MWHVSCSPIFFFKMATYFSRINKSLLYDLFPEILVCLQWNIECFYIGKEHFLKVFYHLAVVLAII